MASIAALWGRCSSGESEPRSAYSCERERSLIGVILRNESDFVDAILENENGSYVDMILKNRSDSYVSMSLERLRR